MDPVDPRAIAEVGYNDAIGGYLVVVASDGVASSHVLAFLDTCNNWPAAAVTQ
jgi:hypothetical protein